MADSGDTADRVRPYLSSLGWKEWLVGGIELSKQLEIGGKYNDVFGTYGRSRLSEAEMLEYSGPEFSFA